MSPNLAKMAHAPLSDYTTGQLRARAHELREMTKTARLDADIRALESLATRFEALATNRGSPECEPSYPPCPEMPSGEDFADAWRMACRHVRKHYTLSETIHHRAVISECYRLACMMVAYGMTSGKSEPKMAVSQPAMAMAIQRRARDHHVIVVDDVADVLVSVGAFLINAGFAVKKAANGDEALRAIASDPSIDVLVTDFAMPGLNGADLIVQARQIRPPLRSVVITGYPNADGLTDLPQGTTVLAKPFRRDALVAAVNALFANAADNEQPQKWQMSVTN